MKKQVIVVLYHFPLDFPCDYIWQTSKFLSKKAPVILFNPFAFPTISNLLFDPTRRKEWLKQRAQKNARVFPSVGLLPFQRFRTIAMTNAWLNYLLLRIYFLFRFGNLSPTMWTFSHHIVDFLWLVRWKNKLVYDRVDQVASIDPMSNKEEKKKDAQLLRLADVVFVNSEYSKRYVKRFNPYVFLTPWGYSSDMRAHESWIEPQDIENIPHPIFLALGHIDHRLDFRFILQAAEHHPGWSFVFVGPVFDFDPQQAQQVNLYGNLTALQRSPNVYFLGKKPKDTVARYIAHADICCVWYDTSQEFVRGSNPMKLYEYLAIGKPVISTPIEAIESYSPVIRIVKDLKSFTVTAKHMLTRRDTAVQIRARRRIARMNSWDHRVNFMWNIMQRLLPAGTYRGR